jgi:hypothetical protein
MIARIRLKLLLAAFVAIVVVILGSEPEDQRMTLCVIDSYVQGRQ